MNKQQEKVNEEENTSQVPTQKRHRQRSLSGNSAPWEPENDKEKQGKMTNKKSNHERTTRQQEGRVRNKLTSEETQAHNGHQEPRQHDNTEDEPAKNNREKRLRNELNNELQNGFDHHENITNMRKRLTTYSKEYEETNRDNSSHQEQELPHQPKQKEEKKTSGYSMDRRQEMNHTQWTQIAQTQHA
jgi:hypothetical protein